MEETSTQGKYLLLWTPPWKTSFLSGKRLLNHMLPWLTTSTLWPLAPEPGSVSSPQKAGFSPEVPTKEILRCVKGAFLTCICRNECTWYLWSNLYPLLPRASGIIVYLRKQSCPSEGLPDLIYPMWPTWEELLLQSQSLRHHHTVASDKENAAKPLFNWANWPVSCLDLDAGSRKAPSTLLQLRQSVSPCLLPATTP